jgi:hypothetical protein
MRLNACPLIRSVAYQAKVRSPQEGKEIEGTIKPLE